MLFTYLSGDKGPFLTITSFIFGNIFVNIQDISFSIAIIVGLLTIVEKITTILKNNKNK
jgi:hypothetical protein